MLASTRTRLIPAFAVRQGLHPSCPNRGGAFLLELTAELSPSALHRPQAGRKGALDFTLLLTTTVSVQTITADSQITSRRLFVLRCLSSVSTRPSCDLSIDTRRHQHITQPSASLAFLPRDPRSTSAGTSYPPCAAQLWRRFFELRWAIEIQSVPPRLIVLLLATVKLFVRHHSRIKTASHGRTPYGPDGLSTGRWD